MGVEALKVFFGWVPLSQHVTPPRLALLLKYSVENAEGAHDPALADMAPSGAAQRKRGTPAGAPRTGFGGGPRPSTPERKPCPRPPLRGEF